MTNEQIEDLKREVYAQTFVSGCTDYGSKMISFTVDVLAERGLIAGTSVPDIILQALRSYRDEHCFDDSEYGIAIDKFLAAQTEKREGE